MIIPLACTRPTFVFVAALEILAVERAAQTRSTSLLIGQNSRPAWPKLYGGLARAPGLPPSGGRAAPEFLAPTSAHRPPPDPAINAPITATRQSANPLIPRLRRPLEPGLISRTVLNIGEKCVTLSQGLL